VVAESFERGVGADRVAGHENALRLFDQRAAVRRRLAGLILGEALKGDVDRALELVRSSVDDVGEDAALGGFADVSGSSACRIAMTGHDASRTISEIRSSA
jgi:hypothetical protein